MGLDNRDYMRPGHPGHPGRRPPDVWARLRFVLWLLARRLRGRRSPRAAPDNMAAGQEERDKKRI